MRTLHHPSLTRPCVQGADCAALLAAARQQAQRIHDGQLGEFVVAFVDREAGWARFLGAEADLMRSLYGLPASGLEYVTLRLDRLEALAAQLRQLDFAVVTYTNARHESN
jgi:hypothetical protein